MTLLRYSIVLIFFCPLAGCMSLSTMQTARTMAKDSIGYIVGFGFMRATEHLGDYTGIGAPFAEAGARYGLSERLDMGAKILIIGAATVDAKYQLVGNKTSKFAGSLGLGVGFFDTRHQASMFQITFPVYLSYHSTEWFALYAGTKYILRMDAYTTGGTTAAKLKLDKSHWPCITTGIKLGKRVGFLAEISYYRNPLFYSRQGFQFTSGFSFGIK